eukprot:4359600-Prymnesium_polylepis.1
MGRRVRMLAERASSRLQNVDLPPAAFALMRIVGGFPRVSPSDIVLRMSSSASRSCVLPRALALRLMHCSMISKRCADRKSMIEEHWLRRCD